MKILKILSSAAVKKIVINSLHVEYSFFSSSADFFKVTFFQQLFQKHYQSVRQLGYKLFGSKLFAKAINR